MSFILNTKVKIPSELETKIKILELAKLHNCEGVVNQLFKNFEYEASFYKNDPIGRVQLVKHFIYTLSEINIALIMWLVDEKGQVIVNGEVAFVLADVPDLK